MKGKTIASSASAKRTRTAAVLIALALSACMLISCGKSEFNLTVFSEKQAVIDAAKAQKDAACSAGTLTVEEGEQIVIAASLTKGSVRVEIIEAPEGSDAENPLETNGNAIISANLKNTDGASSTMAAGKYIVKASCLEKATGTVHIDVTPVK